MTDVPWDQALAAILQAKGLGSQRFGSVVRVAPIETIKAEQQAKAETVEAMFKSAQLELLEGGQSDHAPCGHGYVGRMLAVSAAT
jgi:type IV pilus assembly protein PilQ